MQASYCAIIRSGNAGQATAVLTSVGRGGRGKSGLHRAGCRLTAGRREARNRATETSVFSYGETRYPPSGATPNRQAMKRLAESAGRWLEPVSNGRPRGMVAHDRTRLIGPLFHFPFNSIT